LGFPEIILKQYLGLHKILAQIPNRKQSGNKGKSTGMAKVLLNE
jgi:hypothetical protein